MIERTLAKLALGAAAPVVGVGAAGIGVGAAIGSAISGLGPTALKAAGWGVLGAGAAAGIGFSDNPGSTAVGLGALGLAGAAFSLKTSPGIINAANNFAKSGMSPTRAFMKGVGARAGAAAMPFKGLEYLTAGAGSLAGGATYWGGRAGIGAVKGLAKGAWYGRSVLAPAAAFAIPMALGIRNEMGVYKDLREYKKMNAYHPRWAPMTQGASLYGGLSMVANMGSGSQGIMGSFYRGISDADAFESLKQLRGKASSPHYNMNVDGGLVFGLHNRR